MELRCLFLDLGKSNKNGVVTSRTFLSPEADAEFAVEHAIKCGYRLIDTAVAYKNHRGVGKAIKKCIEEGVIKREELFVTTKLWICDWKAENVKKSIAACLEELQLDYIDLLLIHQAVQFNLPEEEEEKRQKGDFHDYTPFVPDDAKYRIGYSKDRLKETWTALEELYDQVVIILSSHLVESASCYWYLQFLF